MARSRNISISITMLIRTMYHAKFDRDDKGIPDSLEEALVRSH